ncbi:uncharacterized protein BP01DRAFT_360925 [Aspergillus saccharolyticus JOP 1030-1]|uniref:Glycoside hydrolase family 19 catalytic domain-containing protein n=1 Tax=Aspergillus saccharolyticus JOP 1030-1 TaxID=1450539 RepID=A0A318Z0R8_9EURO|nr:hypothetical protein BP01DRAFT_360925 [Aspergillus saccharolyticus JOP 1030-1]PYH40881.1 hypothetical protein BP01DRAFT_360925 [Aspergillus saccharolyticus JOP 1030-1]
MHAGLAWGINKFQIAYILATAEWESKFSPIEEIGGKNKPYAPYYGRGYVQITHKENYDKYSKLLSLDMVTHPEIALRPDVSLVVIVHGMSKGSFTGKKLGDYITDFDHKDYINARRIVNGLDRAAEIAAFATFWEGALSGVNSIGSDPAPRLLFLKPHLGELSDGTEADPRTNQGLEPSEAIKCPPGVQY